MSITFIPKNSDICAICKDFDGKELVIRAAAPQLLECLNAVVQNWKILNDEHFSGPSDKLLALSLLAIAKARGES